MFSENMARPLAVLVIYYQRNFTLFPSGNSRIFFAVVFTISKWRVNLLCIMMKNGQILRMKGWWKRNIWERKTVHLLIKDFLPQTSFWVNSSDVSRKHFFTRRIWNMKITLTKTIWTFSKDWSTAFFLCSFQTPLNDYLLKYLCFTVTTKIPFVILATFT